MQASLSSILSKPKTIVLHDSWRALSGNNSFRVYSEMPKLTDKEFFEVTSSSTVDATRHDPFHDGDECSDECSNESDPKP